MTTVAPFCCWSEHYTSIVFQDRFKITRELGKGAYGMIYQLQVTCDQETDVFASVKVAEPWATESLEAENL